MARHEKGNYLTFPSPDMLLLKQMAKQNLSLIPEGTCREQAEKDG